MVENFKNGSIPHQRPEANRAVLLLQLACLSLVSLGPLALAFDGPRSLPDFKLPGGDLEGASWPPVSGSVRAPGVEGDGTYPRFPGCQEDRGFFAEIGSVRVRGDQFETDAVNSVFEEKEVQFFHDDNAQGSVNTESFGTQSSTAVWSYDLDGQTIVIDEQDDESPLAYAVSKDASILIHASTETGRARC